MYMYLIISVSYNNLFQVHRWVTNSMEFLIFSNFRSKIDKFDSYMEIASENMNTHLRQKI